MQSVGQLLQEARLKKGLTLEQVEKATKIRTKFLKAIEEDDYKKLPTTPYTQGFIKNYSDFLGMRTHTILALFRRQFIQKDKQNRLPIEEPLTASAWQITPNKVIFALVVVLLVALFGYFYHQYQVLHTPPTLRVESPKDDVVTKEEQVPVFGSTDPDATLTINSDPVLVKEDGKFYKDMILTIGGNTIVVEATSRIGKKTTVTKRVTRLPEEENSN